MDKIKKNPTFFVDIDGTLVKYRKFEKLHDSILEPIQDVIDYVNKQFELGSTIIITTARTEMYRHFTVLELNQIGVKYHQLIMGIGRGIRVVINDKDPDNSEIDRAIGINLIRDLGFKSIGEEPNITSYEL